MTELQEKTAKFGGSGGSLTATSKNGTFVTVTSGRADLSSADIRNTLKITRPDGLQLELDGDVRINDSENGSLSVYFPSSGKTCVFDTSGAMTVRQDEADQSGTNKDDIINVKGSLVDGGDGHIWGWSYTFDLADVMVSIPGEDGTVKHAPYPDVCHWRDVPRLPSARWSNWGVKWPLTWSLERDLQIANGFSHAVACA